MAVLYILGIVIFVAFFVGVFYVLVSVPFSLWFSAKNLGISVPFRKVLLLSMHNTAPEPILKSLIEAHKAGLKQVNLDDLEAHYLSEGNVEKVIHAMVAASKSGFDLSFEKATSIDLSGRDVLDVVQTTIHPKVIRAKPIAAYTKDEIQVNVNAEITVRTNPDRIVGGAGEDTLLARVSESVIKIIGGYDSYQEVVGHIDDIVNELMNQRLDSTTVYDIMHINLFMQKADVWGA